MQTGSGVQAMAVGDGDVQTRTFPGDIGLYKSGGWEIVEEAALTKNAQRIGEEAIALLTAPQCPSGTFDIILGGSQVSLQIHESCGHPAELDRVMGWEANFSGTSFLEIPQLGKLRYGSPTVTIVIDNTLPSGMATCGYDDEGTKSGTSDIVRDGVLRGYEMSNDTARAIGRASNACVRAQSWEYVPMIRMCNLNLLPGDVPFDELFDDVNDGIYMEGNRSWSIDDRRLNFQFGCQIGWEIKNGKRGRMLKNPTYAGVTPQFWNACDAIADRGVVVRVGDAELRQRRTDAVRAHDAGRRTGALSQRERGSRLSVKSEQRETIAQRAVERSRADQTEVRVSFSDESLTRFTHGISNQNVAANNVTISIRAIVDGRTGVATSNDPGDAAVDALLAQALDMAAFAPSDPLVPKLPLGGPTQVPPGCYVEATASCRPAQREPRSRMRSSTRAERGHYWCAGLRVDLERRHDDRQFVRRARVVRRHRRTGQRQDDRS